MLIYFTINKQFLSKSNCGPRSSGPKYLHTVCIHRQLLFKIDFNAFTVFYLNKAESLDEIISSPWFVTHSQL